MGLLCCVVIGLHFAAIYAVLSTRSPQLQIATISINDLTEGASTNELLEVIAIEDVLPITPKAVIPPKESFAVEAPIPEQADVIEPPPLEKVEFKSEEKEPEKVVKETQQVVQQPIPLVKTKPTQPIKQERKLAVKAVKTKSKSESRIATKIQQANSNRTIKGSSGSSQLAQGKQGEGIDRETSASHLGRYLHNPKPPYPAVSIENEEEGTVTLRVVVEPNGRPSKVELVQTSGYRRLDQAALKVVKEKYQFIPATRLGQAIQSSYTFNIQFSLRDR